MFYFQDFPIIKYKFPDGNVLDTTYLFVRPELKIVDRDGYNVEGIQYIIEDGKSPDNVSKEIYGDSSLFWIILLQNNIIDFYSEWPKMYNDWLQELSIINSDFSFFTKFKMDIRKNDIVVKYKSNKNGFFEENDYGIITEYDPFFRRFDVKMTKGSIEIGDYYMILRKNENSYITIKTPNNETSQQLIKKVNKLDSPVGFEKIDSNTGNKIPISPYYSLTDETLLSDQTDDLSTISNSVLYNYMNSTLGSYLNVFEITLKQQKEKSFIFTRKIKTIPSIYLNSANRKYLNAITKESGNI